MRELAALESMTAFFAFLIFILAVQNLSIQLCMRQRTSLITWMQFASNIAAMFLLLLFANGQ